MKRLNFKIYEQFNGFLVCHMEKVVLLGSIVLAALFFTSGYFVDGLATDKSPAALRIRLDAARRHIHADRWSLVKLARTPDLRHPERVDEGRLPTREKAYGLVRLARPLHRPKTLRTDPHLYPPIQLEVHSGWVPLAYVPAKGESDALSALPISVLPDEEELARPRKRQARRKTTGNSLLSGSSLSFADDSTDNATRAPAKEQRVLTPHQQASLGGFVPAGAALAKSKYLVAVKAVVPYEQQCRTFDELRNTSDYNARRDAPVYRWFYVERAEVPADPEEPLYWISVRTKDRGLSKLGENRGWVATATELVDSESISEVLTLPIPPVLTGSLKPWGLHSEVAERREVVFEESDKALESWEEDVLYGPRPPTSGNASQRKKTYQERSHKNAPTAPASPARFKLIRFYDTTAELGKAYRYRIKVQLFDPNRPANTKDSPRSETLAPAVKARLKSLDASEGASRKTYWVESAWSEPSEIVRVEFSPQRLLASKVWPARETVLPSSAPGKIKFAEQEPQAEVVASIWDHALAVKVATELKLVRGSVLRAATMVDLLHPLTRQFHAAPAYEFKTGAVLLDMRGGDSLPGSAASQAGRLDPFRAPGEFLIVDRHGNLLTGDEFDDAEERRRELFLEDLPPPVGDHASDP